MNPLSEESIRRLMRFLGGKPYRDIPKHPCFWNHSDCDVGECGFKPQNRWDTCIYGKRTPWTWATGNRTFTTWQDLGDVRGALVKKELYNKFVVHCVGIEADLDSKPRALYDAILQFTDWLFRPTDENGEPHFCRLVAEFLKEMEAKNG